MTGAGAAAHDTREFTFRGMCLGAVMTVLFMSANLYLGLKTGLTFSSSIPAATISMGAFALLGGAGILENNIVQTQASAAGTLCNVILVIPGLLLVHFWHDFPLWQTMLLCLLGGLLGVAYSVPLRRVLVVGSDLPFPEGVAAAEVLRSAPSQGGGDGGLRVLSLSAAGAGLFNLLAGGFRLFPDQVNATLQYGQAVFRFGGSYSLALIGVGYLVRIGACLALLLGIIIAWGIAVPILTSTLPIQPDGAAAAAETVWSEKVRLIGAGIIAVAGLWTVVMLARPMLDAFRPDRRGPAKPTRDDVGADRDVPILYVGLAILALGVASAFFFGSFAAQGPFANVLILFSIVVAVLTAVFGLLMATACGYMAGLLGSSSSPISGIGILTVMLVAVGLSLVPGVPADEGATRFIAAFALFVTSFIVTTCSIANDNLQDLKTGHMIGATPWKQQVALAIGVVIGAVTVAPILQILYDAYGFVGAFPHAGMNPANALPAPQATLITQIAQGIVEHHLNWTMVTIGAVLGVGFVVAEVLLGRVGFSLPAMTVGIGVYLPFDVVLTIALGGVLGWLTEQAFARGVRSDEARDAGRRRGVLAASGFLVGESLVGIVIAMSDAWAGRSDSLALASHLHGVALDVSGALVFAAILAAFYLNVVKLQRA